jgi:hypothetical protein
MDSRLCALGALCGLVFVASPATADFSQTFTGSNVNGPTWNRPIDDGPVLRESDNQHYSAQRFSLPVESKCRINSVQTNFNGYIHLYRGSFNPANPLTNLLGGDDDDSTPGQGLGIGSSVLKDPSDNADEPSMLLSAGNYVLVTSGFSAEDQGSFTTFIHCSNGQPVQGTCAFSGSSPVGQICLQNRFAVRIINVTNSQLGFGIPVRYGSEDSAFFWFFSDQNFEVVVKVLNACILNGRYWVFAAGLTDQGYRIEVRDTLPGGSTKAYTNTLGNRAPATTDTNAFSCI